MPQLDYIKINGVKYDINPSPDVAGCLEAPQRYFSAVDENDFWQTWEMRSFQGGERRTRILAKEHLEEMTYDDGEGIDVSTWGQLKLQPDLARSLTVSSATLPMVVCNDGTTVLVGHTALSGKYLSTYRLSTWTGEITPNAAAVTDLVVGTGQNVYGIQGGKIIESVNNGMNWTNNATSGVPSDMVALAFCANQLYALGPTYLKYWDGSAWTTAAEFGGSYACTYGEQVYFAKDNILYRYNGTSAFETDRLPQGFVITGLYPYRNILFMPGYFAVQGGKKGAVYYIMDGRDAHLYNIGAYEGSSNNTVSALAGSDDEIYLANQKRGGADRYDMSVGGLSSGPAWRAAGVIPYKSMAYSDGKLLIGRYDGVAGTDGVYIANVAIPTAYETSGWVTTPEYEWFLPHDNKVFSQIVLWHKALATGESVKVEYSLDGGVTYSLAGYSDVTGSTSRIFKITNARGRSVKLRLTLAGPGTSTPTVTYLRVDAAPLAEARSMWDLNLVAYSPMQGRRKITELKNAYNSQSVVEFEDLYGDTHSVVFDTLQVRTLTGDKWTAQIGVRLREV